MLHTYIIRYNKCLDSLEKNDILVPSDGVLKRKILILYKLFDNLSQVRYSPEIEEEVDKIVSDFEETVKETRLMQMN